ncbi:hypothetical protein PATA110616_11750 [Paenibacillus tarimensis]
MSSILKEWLEQKKIEAVRKYEDYGPQITDYHFVWDDCTERWIFYVEILLEKPFVLPWVDEEKTYVMNAAFPVDPEMNDFVQVY